MNRDALLALAAATVLCHRGRAARAAAQGADAELAAHARRWASGQLAHRPALEASLRADVTKRYGDLEAHLADCTDCRPRPAPAPRRGNRYRYGR